MKVALITANWNFLGPINKVLEQDHYEVKQYIPTNVTALNYANMIHLMNWCDVAFFDFAQSPLVEMSHLAVKPCKIVVRVLGLEVFHAAHLVNWNNVDFVIVISEHQKERLLENLHARGIKISCPIEVVPLGVDVEMFSPPREGKTYGFNICQVGNMLPHKRHYETIQMFKELIQRSPPHWDWKLHIHHATAGTWRSEQQKEYTVFCKDLVNTLELGDRVVFHSYDHLWQDGSGKRFFADKDIVISNSMMEGYHKTPMEGMACGVMPLINCWRGSDMIYPPDFIFYTFEEAIQKLLWYGNLSEEAKESFSVAHRKYVVKGHNEQLHALRIRDILLLVVTGTPPQVVDLIESDHFSLMWRGKG